MNRRSESAKKLTVLIVFIGVIFLSSLYTINSINTISNNYMDEIEKNDVPYKEMPKLSIDSVDDTIIGDGENQKVRLYLQNHSKSFNNNNGTFNISSPLSNMNLTKGTFNFSFQSNYTAMHVIEDENPFNLSESILFGFNIDEESSNLTLNEGKYLTNAGMFNLTDIRDGLDHFWKVNSSNTGIVNFSLKINFSNQFFSKTDINLQNLKFNRSKILGLIYNLTYNITNNALLTVQVKNNSIPSQPNWVNLTNNLKINSSNGKVQEINDKFINTNLAYINSTDCVNFRFIFKNQTTGYENYNLTLFKIKSNASYIFDLPISNESQVALEFDLRGLNTTVNGFYAWIRTLNLTAAQKVRLNFSLYRSNITTVRTESNLRTKKLGPDYSKKIYNTSIDFNGYHGDKVAFFKFDTSKTTGLNVSNYFIVIKSNCSEIAHSLVTLPYYQFGYGDGVTDHQLKKSSESGTNWQKAELRNLGTSGYNTRELDAASFKINVTRGYMPSDFILNGTATLKFQNITIAGHSITDYPYNSSSPLQWGRGRISLQNFTSPISADEFGNFQLQLSWNHTITKDFKFNVSFNVIGYHLENATSKYYATYNENPQWILNHTMYFDDPKFDNWALEELWFLYPQYYMIERLNLPNGTDVLDEAIGPVSYSSSKYQIRLSKEFINTTNSNFNGSYLLNFTSYNCIRDMNSYINFKGNLIESTGFMFGDNVSVDVQILDNKFFAPKNGTANVSLFKPDGNRYVGANLSQNVSKIINGDYSLFDFDNRNVINITNAITQFGTYKLGFFWTNGTQVGCKTHEIYIDYYSVNISGCEYYEIQNKNILQGTVIHRALDNISLLIASVNETTGVNMPNFYSIDKEDLNYGVVYEAYNEEFPVKIKRYAQKENIINPGENINFKVEIENQHNFVDLDVKVGIRMVSYANDDWIIAEKNSTTVNLNYLGTNDDENLFDIDLPIPAMKAGGIWNGLNAPIRKAGAKIQIIVYIEGTEAGTYKSNEISLLVHETQDNFEGHILSLKETYNTKSISILKGFDRDECSYYPNQTSFLINVYDYLYMSSYNVPIENYTFKMDTEFTDVYVNPHTPRYGENYTISSTLKSELGAAIVNRMVSIQTNTTGTWETLGSAITDSNGNISLTFNTSSLLKRNKNHFKLVWAGDDELLSSYKTFYRNFTALSNEFILSSPDGGKVLHRNDKGVFELRITNNGQTNLKIQTISLNISQGLKYELIEVEGYELNNLAPSESTVLKYEIDIPNLSTDNITVRAFVNASNILTKETVKKNIKLEFVVLDRPVIDYFLMVFIAFMLAIFAALYFLAYVYGKRVIEKIEAPLEKKPKKGAPKRGGYKKVSEIDAEKKSEEKKKTLTKSKKKSRSPEKEGLVKEKPGETTKDKKGKSKKSEKTDLDSLLESKGLDKKD